MTTLAMTTPLIRQYQSLMSKTPVYITIAKESKESEEEPFNTAIDTTSDDSAITMCKPVTAAFISDQV